MRTGNRKGNRINAIGNIRSIALLTLITENLFRNVLNVFSYFVSIFSIVLLQLISDIKTNSFNQRYK